MQKYKITNFGLNYLQYGNFELIQIKESWLDDREVIPAPHRHSFHEIILLQKGEELHYVDFKAYGLKAQELLFIPKGSIHDFKPSDSTLGWKLIFDNSFFSTNRWNLIKDFQLLIPHLGQKSFMLNNENYHIFSQSIELLKILSTKQKEVVLVNLLTFLNDYFEQSTKIIDSQYIRFLNLLNQEIYNHRKATYYARKLSISPKSLNEIVKKATGKTTLHYIHQRIMDEAKSELINSEKSISEISYSLGYEDALYFSRIFKKKTNFSPKRFRKEFAKMSIR